MASESLEQWVDNLHPCYLWILRAIGECPGLRTPRRQVRSDEILATLGADPRLDSAASWRKRQFHGLLHMLEQRGLIELRLAWFFVRPCLLVRPTAIGDRVITLITGVEPLSSGIPPLDPLPKPRPSPPPPPPPKR